MFSVQDSKINTKLTSNTQENLKLTVIIGLVVKVARIRRGRRRKDEPDLPLFPAPLPLKVASDLPLLRFIDKPRWI